LRHNTGKAGISFAVANGELGLEADDEPPADLVEAIIRQKTEIIALLAGNDEPSEPIPTAPKRYRNAWARFQLRRPAGVTEQAWRRPSMTPAGSSTNGASLLIALAGRRAIYSMCHAMVPWALPGGSRAGL
jgi:hypothetical protein